MAEKGCLLEEVLATAEEVARSVGEWLKVAGHMLVSCVGAGLQAP